MLPESSRMIGAKSASHSSTRMDSKTKANPPRTGKPPRTLIQSRDLGRIEVSRHVVATIAGHAAAGCYGVVAMAARGLRDGLAERLHRDEVDALNVFPVPDGDTGTNMLLTLQSAVEDIRDVDDADLSRTAKRASHGALMGARGNSGVILSQILRGFCVGIGSRPAVDAGGLAKAFREGADVAYRAVIKPTEGTMLRV